MKLKNNITPEEYKTSVEDTLKKRGYWKYITMLRIKKGEHKKHIGVITSNASWEEIKQMTQDGEIKDNVGCFYCLGCGYVQSVNVVILVFTAILNEKGRTKYDAGDTRLFIAPNGGSIYDQSKLSLLEYLGIKKSRVEEEGK